MARVRVVAKPVRTVKQSRFRSKMLKVPDVEQTNSAPVRERHRKFRVEEEMLRACLSEGMTRDDILATMDIKEEQLAVIEKRLLANDGQRQLAMSAAHRYYIYCLQQEQCVRDLDFFVQEIYDASINWNKAAKRYKDAVVARKVIGNAPSAQAAILAIKAKSDILERSIKMGQDLGIVQKRAKEIRVSGQLNLAALPTEQLRVALQKKLAQFDDLVSKGKLPSTYQKMLMGSTNERSVVPGGCFKPEPVMDAEFEETTS